MATLYSIGIDFGTANSCVAFASYHDRGGGQVDPDPLHRPEVVPFHNRDTVPTAIHLGDGKDQPVTFGRMAEERGAVDPEKLYTGFKLSLGSPEKGQDAFHMAKFFLTYLRKRVDQFVPISGGGPGERVETIVGHPVQWSADQREATLSAAQEAGFPNVRLEEESMAALYCHVFDERSGFDLKPGSYVLTIDMGGGTTDFAFLQIPHQPGERPVSIPVHPQEAEGRSYGGRDLDRLLLQYLSREWDAEIFRENAPFLIREVRQFKETFSSNLSEGAREYENKIVLGDHAQRVRLTRDEFEQIAANYIKYFEVLVRGAVREAQLRPDQVTHIILTGGHSRWYFVERTLGTVFPHLWNGPSRAIFRHSHPEQSVARGLAYDPMARSSQGGFVNPLRRATHAVWLEVPRAESNGSGKPAADKSQEPTLLIPRGTLLPFKTTSPIRVQVQQRASGAQETSVTLRFLTGHRRLPLADRSATFQRGFWEQVSKSISSYLRPGSPPTDRFDIEVGLDVDEHELIQAVLRVTRYLGDRPVDVQTHPMEVSLSAPAGQ